MDRLAACDQNLAEATRLNLVATGHGTELPGVTVGVSGHDDAFFNAAVVTAPGSDLRTAVTYFEELPFSVWLRDGLDPQVSKKVDFYTRQFVDAMAPTNFVMTNPDVLKATLDTHRDHLITATLASVAYQTEELLSAMVADGVSVSRLRVDGGMVANNWLCQFLADIADVPIERPAYTETTALGAALLAAVGAGLASNLTDAARMWSLEREFLPAMAPNARARLLDGWRQAVARAL